MPSPDPGPAAGGRRGQRPDGDGRGVEGSSGKVQGSQKSRVGGGGGGDRWVAGIEACAMAVNMGSLLIIQILNMCLWGHCSSYNFEDPA